MASKVIPALLTIFVIEDRHRQCVLHVCELYIFPCLPISPEIECHLCYLFSSCITMKRENKGCNEGSFKRHCVHRRANPESCSLPKEYEDGLSVRHSIQKLIIVQKWLDGINESCVHFVHFIKYEN